MKMEKRNWEESQITLDDLGSDRESQFSEIFEPAHPYQNRESENPFETSQSESGELSDSSSQRDAKLLLNQRIDMKIVEQSKLHDKSWNEISSKNSYGPDSHYWCI